MSSATMRFYGRMKAQGRCVQCGAFLEDGSRSVRCERCRAAMRRTQDAYRARVRPRLTDAEKESRQDSRVRQRLERKYGPIVNQMTQPGTVTRSAILVLVDAAEAAGFNRGYMTCERKWAKRRVEAA